jgi:hypothetical protein
MCRILIITKLIHVFTPKEKGMSKCTVMHKLGVHGQQEYLDSADEEIKSKEWCLDSAGLGLSFKFE